MSDNRPNDVWLVLADTGQDKRAPPMTAGERLRDARLATGLTQTEFGLALGYQHRNPNNVKGMISAMESGKRAVTPAIARLAAMYARFGVPAEFR